MSIIIKGLSPVVRAIVVSAVCAGVVALLFVALGPSSSLAARMSAPRIQEQPGGFDPLPEFDATRAELAFRGVECVRDVAVVRHRLIRLCTGG